MSMMSFYISISTTVGSTMRNHIRIRSSISIRIRVSVTIIILTGVILVIVIVGTRIIRTSRP